MENIKSSIDNGFRKGVLFIVLAMLILPAIDAIAKGLSDTISAGEVAWVRLIFQTIFLFPFVVLYGFTVKGPIWIHISRGVLMAGVWVLFVIALAVMPLANVIAIFFISPLILTLLGVFFLGEPIGWRRVSAIIAGLFGALLITQPSYSDFGSISLLPACAAIGFAVYMLLTRKLARGSEVYSAISMQFYAGLFGTIFLTGALIAGALMDVRVLSIALPNRFEWSLLVLLAIIATVGHILIALAASRIGAGQIAPFLYLEIIGATTLGLIFFGDFPDYISWIGIIIIISSGLYVYYREAIIIRVEASLLHDNSSPRPPGGAR